MEFEAAIIGMKRLTRLAVRTIADARPPRLRNSHDDNESEGRYNYLA
jgi:hypothetical protein